MSLNGKRVLITRSRARAEAFAGLLAESADMLMVKPALHYLDVIQRVRESYPELPVMA